MTSSGVFLVNFEHILHLVSIIDFEQVNFSWLDICIFGNFIVHCEYIQLYFSVSEE